MIPDAGYAAGSIGQACRPAISAARARAALAVPGVLVARAALVDPAAFPPGQALV